MIVVASQIRYATMEPCRYAIRCRTEPVAVNTVVLGSRSWTSIAAKSSALENLNNWLIIDYAH